MVTFILQPATKVQMRKTYSSALSLTSALDGCGWSRPRRGRFAPGNYPVGDWMGRRTGLGVSVKP
jgi:hypothetical protein